MPPPDLVVLGMAIGVHGVRGDVRVRIFGDGPETLLAAEELWFGKSREDPRLHRFEVMAGGNARPGEVKLRLAGIADRDSAMALRGQLVMGDVALLAELPEGEFYWHDLIGCRVEERGGRVVGTVVEIWETGAHDVLVIESDRGERHLLPTARELVPEIDLEARRIVCESVPGLFDAD